MQWSKTACPYLKTVLRQGQNQEQTQQVRLPEQMPDIGRVVCAWGQCLVRSKQWRQDTLTVTGGVSAWVLYLPEEEQSPQSLEVWLPFQVKWTLPQTQREGSARISCLLTGVDARLLSARKLLVRSAVSLVAEGTEPAEAEVSTPTDLPQGVEVLTQTYPARLPRESGEKEFTFEDEVHQPNVKKWLSWSIQPQITEQSVLGGRVVLRGNGQLHYTYLDQQDGIHSGCQEIPFAQFAELDREYDKQATAHTVMTVSALEPEIRDEGAVIRCSVTAQYLIWDSVLLEVGEDAYSPNRQVELSVDTLTLPMELDRWTETVDVPMPQPEGKVLDISFLPEHPQLFREGDTVSMDAAGAFQILYEDPAGQLQGAMETWSDTRTMAAGEGALLWAQVQSVTQQGSGGQVQMEMLACSEQAIPMITALTLGEPVKQSQERPALLLRRMNEQSLWHLAKATGSTREAICKANALSGEPDQGQMLLIPIL